MVWCFFGGIRDLTQSPKHACINAPALNYNPSPQLAATVKGSLTSLWTSKERHSRDLNSALNIPLFSHKDNSIDDFISNGLMPRHIKTELHWVHRRADQSLPLALHSELKQTRDLCFLDRSCCKALLAGLELTL